MGTEVKITREHAQAVLDELHALHDDLIKTGQKYQRMKTLDYVGGGFGLSLKDGETRKKIVREAGETTLQWVDDLAKHVKAIYDKRKATFDALFGADWDSGQSINKVQDQIDQAGH